MIQARGFSGKLNQDDSPFRLPAGDYTDALNITRDAQGVGNDEIITNVPGNEVVNYAFEAGTNKVIGNYADKVRNRQYIFVWNSTGYHEITYYDANLNTIVKVIKNLTDTGGVDVLKFDPSWKINHIDIIYRDEEGDLLYWTDGLNPPRKINVKTATLGNYGVIISSYLDVAKEPPSAPPYCVYEDDVNVKVNNLNNKQFKFKYRFVFDDFEKSVTSAQSEIPIPYDYSQQSVVTDQTKNADIFIAFQTGAKNVTKIELLAAQSQGVTFSDYFLIQVIDKAELSLNDNDVAYYRFYNNEAYNIIPIKESIQPFDTVPLKAYTQSLPNGNVLDYGAITEGYNLIEPNYNSNGLLYQESYLYTSNFLILAYQNAQPAFDTGNIKIIMAANGIVTPGLGGSNQKGLLYNGTITVNIIDNGNPVSLSVTVPAFPLNIPLSISGPYSGLNVITEFSNQAIALGFTVVSTGSNELVIFKSGAALSKVSNTSSANPSVNNTILPSLDGLNNNSQFAYDWNSKYGFGVVYFDEKGRTNGVVYSPQTSIETNKYSELTVPLSNDKLGSNFLPKIQLTINSRPPDWAYYFEIVRTNNITKSNFLYWITENTYKDTISDVNNYKYAYISIANLTYYILANPNIKTLGYEFAPGDRIRFIKLYNGFGGTAQLYADAKDFQIVDVLVNYENDGQKIKGQVIKIILPNTDSTFNFGATGFENYLIQLYTPSLNYSNELNLYYEFGERYIVGNPGTANAYHQGMTQNQTANLSQPALYTFYKGDSYYRSRQIPTRGQATITFQNKTGIAGTYSPMTSFVSNNSTHDDNYTLNSVPVDDPNNQITINNQKPLSFTIKGTITLKSSVTVSNIPFVLFLDFSGSFNLMATFSFTAGVEYVIPINTTITTNALDTYGRFQLVSFNGELVSCQLAIIDGLSIYQGIIDPNFSDTYDSSATPNGRPWKYDPNALQVFNPALIRFGDEFQPGTTINNTNRFYEDNFDVYDRSKGGIKKMFIEGRNQYVFQQFDVGVVTILTQIVRDTAGNPLSAQSDKLLNKIVYPYQGGYGIGEFPESFAYGKNAKYFIDGNKGVVVRLAQNGMTPISIVYKMNAFFVPRVAKYKDAFVPTTGRSTIYGAFDAYTNKYIIAMEEVYDSTPAVIQDAKTIAFLETATNKEGFESFLSFLPENMGALNNQFFSFKAGQIWKHLTPDPISGTPAFCNFYNTQYSAEVQVVFNETPLMKKYFLSIMESANTAWECPDIVSQLDSYSGTAQLTAISSARFKLLEGQYYSAIFRDINSKGGLINGAIMHGNYLIVRFKKDQASSFVYLNAVSLNYKESPLNLR